MLALLALTLLAADVARPFAEERLLLDRRLETLRRILPDGPNPGADIALVRELATNARLEPARDRGPAPGGSRSAGRRDPRPLGHRPLRRPRPLLPPGGAVRPPHRRGEPHPGLVPGRPRAPHRGAAPALPAPSRPPARGPRRARGHGPAGIPRPTAEAFVRDQGLALAKSEAIAALRRTPPQPAPVPVRDRRHRARPPGDPELRLPGRGVPDPRPLGGRRARPAPSRAASSAASFASPIS